MLAYKLKRMKRVALSITVSLSFTACTPALVHAHQQSTSEKMSVQHSTNNPLLILKPEGKHFFTCLYHEFKQAGEADTHLAHVSKSVIQGLDIISLHDCIDALIAAQTCTHNRKIQDLASNVFEDLFLLTKSMNEEHGRFSFGESETRTLQIVNMCQGDIENLNVDMLQSLNEDFIAVKDVLCLDSTAALSTNHLSPKDGSTITIDGSINLTTGNTVTIDGTEIGGPTIVGNLNMNGNNIDNVSILNATTVNATDACISGTLQINALHCKDNDPLYVDCGIRLNGNLQTNTIEPRTGTDVCITPTLRVNFICPKVGNFLQLNNCDLGVFNQGNATVQIQGGVIDGVSFHGFIGINDYDGDDLFKRGIQMFGSHPSFLGPTIVLFRETGGANNWSIELDGQEGGVKLRGANNSVFGAQLLGRGGPSSSGVLRLTNNNVTPGETVTIEGANGPALGGAIHLTNNVNETVTIKGSDDIIGGGLFQLDSGFGIKTIEARGNIGNAAGGLSLRSGTFPNNVTVSLLGEFNNHGGTFILRSLQGIDSWTFNYRGVVPPLLPRFICKNYQDLRVFEAGASSSSLPDNLHYGFASISSTAGAQRIEMLGDFISLGDTLPGAVQQWYNSMPTPQITVRVKGVNGSVEAFAFIVLSDDRVKTNETPVDTDDMLQKINTLEVSTFKWEQDYVGTPTVEQQLQYGFIAQDVEAVFPELVTNSHLTATIDSVLIENLKTVDYTKMSAVAIAGIQELDKRFTDNTRTTTFGANVLMTGNLQVEGNFSNPSDFRIKEKVVDIKPEDSLEVISKLNAKTYKLSEAFSGVPVELQPAQIGFIAQEVQKVMPEVVHTAQARGVGDQIMQDFLALDYGRMVVHTANAAKGLQQELNAKSEQLKAVEQELAGFKAYATEQIELLHQQLAQLTKAE